MQNKLTDAVVESAADNINKTWAQTLFGDSAEFPDINDPLSKKAPIKPRRVLTSALKQVVHEHKEEENRLNNVILFQVPEQSGATHEERMKAETDYIRALLDEIKVDAKPLKSVR